MSSEHVKQLPLETIPVEELAVCLACKDTRGRYTFVSRMYADLLGTIPKSVVGKSDVDFFPPEIADRLRELDAAVFKTGKPRVSTLHLGVAARNRIFELHSGPLLDANRVIVGIQTVFVDVTERQRFEKSLSQERDMLQTIMDNLPDFIYVKDVDGHYVVINEAVRKILGAQSTVEVIGRTNFDFLPADQAHNERQDDDLVISTGEPLVEREECMRGNDGSDLWILTSKLPLRDGQGQITGLVGIDRDITHLKRAEAGLRAAKEEADAANRAKGDFLANMSHEIRTPLNAIIGMTDLLLETTLTTIQREYLNLVQSSGESLLALINDILDFSKIEAGKLELESVVFDIRDCLGDAMKSLGLRAYEKRIELAVHVDCKLPRFVIGDPGRLRQIVVNLVGNAIKFTELGEVVLDIVCEARSADQVKIRVAVTDTGIGIPKDKCDKIFDEFEQADASTTRRFGGTGLGLAICSRLVELMGGRIWVESEPGKGSKFQFTAALGIDPNQSDELPREHAVVVSGLRVLIVDDNATNRRILKDMLTNWGMSPVTASGATQGLNLLADAVEERDPIRIVISDVNMPDIDGISLAREILARRLLPISSVILLTSGARPDNVSELRELGVVHHLMKPVKQSELFTAMVSTLDVSDSASLVTAVSDSKTVERRFSRQLRVLLAEDNSVNQKLALGILGKLGHEVAIANNGMEALACLRSSERFDLVLMDVQMPEMDGLTATRQIRSLELETGGHLPIVAMTAHAMKGDREECLQAGMDDYLTKPIRLQDIAQKIDNIFSAPQAKSRNPVKSWNRSTDSLQPPSAEEARRDVVSWSDALRNTGGDVSLLNEVVTAFLDEAPRMIGRADEAVARNDVDLLQNAAHSLKGSLLFLNVQQLIDSIERVENLAAKQQLAGAVQELESFKHDF
jgi:PAS domain S-box-containing protein